MKSGTLLIVGLLGWELANGYRCNEDETLKLYRIADGGGYVTGSTKRDTPPSTTEEKWWINACVENDKNEKPSECDGKDVVCGITYVSVPDKDTLLTQVIEFSRDLPGPVQEIDNGVRLTWKGANWGSETFDAEVEFRCDNNLKTDEMVSSTWQNKLISISVKGPSGCLTKSDDGGKDTPPQTKKPKKGTSWFTWILLYALLFTLIYLMVTAYVNTRGGSFQDFREEFIDRSRQLITSLPAFMKEVTARIFGSGSSQRGGYSAV